MVSRDTEAGLRELAGLWLAETADDLHRVLALVPAVRATSDAYEPMDLLRTHHEREPASTMNTAVLVLTDRRWKGAVGPIVRRVEAGCLLSPADLDALARTFIAAGTHVFWPAPAEWWAEGDMPASSDRLRPVVVKRPVYPPVRRWAAHRLVRADAGVWPSLVKRSEELGGAGGAALWTGLLDAVDELAPRVRSLVIDLALTSSRGVVRQAALTCVGRLDGPDRAYELGRRDPNAHVREHVDRLRRRAIRPPRSVVPAEIPAGRSGPPEGVEHPRLF
jgi:hypothetical protein